LNNFVEIILIFCLLGFFSTIVFMDILFRVKDQHD
jgi:hypothetical protein